MHDNAYIAGMYYHYDPDKRESNLNKHGLDFEAARTLIESEQNVTFEDKRFDYREQRFVTLGLLRGRVAVVVTAETEDEVRVISMRWATKHEQDIYFRNL